MLPPLGPVPFAGRVARQGQRGLRWWWPPRACGTGGCCRRR